MKNPTHELQRPKKQLKMGEGVLNPNITSGRPCYLTILFFEWGLTDIFKLFCAIY